MKKLMLLITVMCLGAFVQSYGQKGATQPIDTVCMTGNEYKQVLKLEADYNKTLDRVKSLVEDTLVKHNEIERKEGVILRRIAERNANKKLADSALALHELDSKIIIAQDKVIRKIGKIKRWAIGPNVSYGISTGKPSIFLGAGLTYGLIRF